MRGQHRKLGGKQAARVSVSTAERAGRELQVTVLTENQRESRGGYRIQYLLKTRGSREGATGYNTC